MNISGYMNGNCKTGVRTVQHNLGELTAEVEINDEQYIGNVPLKAWELTIDSYQTSQKWLKNRRDRTLSMEDIQHYQKIIVALTTVVPYSANDGKNRGYDVGRACRHSNMVANWDNYMLIK